MNAIRSAPTQSWVAGLRAITSKCRNCNRSLLLRQLSVQRAGIRIRDAWYCSSACFTSAAEQEISALLKSGMDREAHVSRMPLGLVLISQGLLTSAQLREVTDEQRQFGGEIGELLVRRGSVSERQVTAVRATQWGCPVFAMPKHLARAMIHIPSTFMKLYSAVPLLHVAATKFILVGFVHGIDYGLLYAVEQMTGCKTQPCFVTPSDFQVQMMRQVQSDATGGDATPDEIKFEAKQSVAEMAATLCTYGADLEADQVILEKCKEYLWARLSCGAREVDLLFRAG